ncbi:hypothetical protein Q7P37_001930 [Cladosporium fusiforme]
MPQHMGSGGRGTNKGSGKTSREAAPKGVEKKVAKQPIKVIKEKVVAAKEAAKAKKEAKKASHTERKANYDEDVAIQEENKKAWKAKRAHR